MKRWLSHRSFFVYLAALLVFGAVILMSGLLGGASKERITTTVDTGPVRQVVSVTGAIRAENTAELGFPVGGTTEAVYVRKGDVVATGSPLARLSATALRADVLDAEAALRSAQANLAELRSGVRSETRRSTEETVELKAATLARTRSDEAQKIENARRLLLSSNLAAVTAKSGEDATAPVISGSYDCDAEGTYTLTVYSSASQSGYSIRTTGLESGTYEASFNQPLPFGTCGLRAQLVASGNYQNSIWLVEIPNTKASTFTTNNNAYELARTSAASAIQVAEQELAVAKADATLATAPARSEELSRAEAAVASAAANLLRVQAGVRDTVLEAPFSGTVTNVTAVKGEAVSSSPIITLLAADRYELIARIPEIDIGKLTTNQRAEVVFDSSANDTLTAIVDFISPDATVIDGVAYYEARLALDTVPAWIRSGLNADIDIIINEVTGPRLPRRFITTSNDTSVVLLPTSDTTTASGTTRVNLVGNDGFVSTPDLIPGTVVVAP